MFNGSKSLNNKGKVKVDCKGHTVDGKMVISGNSLFRFVETKGVPLDFLLSSLDKDLYVVDWLEFILVSVQNNWKLKGTLLKIENSLIDVYGRDYSTPIIEKINRRCLPFMEDL